MAEDNEKWQPTWLYKVGEDGEVVSECFVDGPPEDPANWHDSPEGAKPKKRGPGRPPKVASEE